MVRASYVGPPLYLLLLYLAPPDATPRLALYAMPVPVHVGSDTE